MRQLLGIVSLALLALLGACGGGSGGGEPWAFATSAQSAALATPGSATASADGRTINLMGGDSGTSGCSGAQYGFTSSPCLVIASAAEGKGSYAFNWSYTTKDTAGPGADVFGMIVDGKMVPISDPGGAQQQSGQLQVSPASSLAFFINCTDCTDGRAEATVSSFQAR